MEQYIEKLKEAIADYKRFGKLADAAEAELDKDPLNLKKEHEFDVYYHKEVDALMQASRYIVILTSGKCELKIARQMVIERTDEVIDLVNRARV